MSETAQTINMIIFCPECHSQHVDEAKPGVCQDCGHPYLAHLGKNGFICNPDCACMSFNAWLNPSHKSHRCENCNLVFRIADVPTNGVKNIETKGSNDTWAIHVQSAGE